MLLGTQSRAWLALPALDASQGLHVWDQLPGRTRMAGQAEDSAGWGGFPEEEGLPFPPINSQVPCSISKGAQRKEGSVGRSRARPRGLQHRSLALCSSGLLPARSLTGLQVAATPAPLPSLLLTLHKEEPFTPPPPKPNTRPLSESFSSFPQS